VTWFIEAFASIFKALFSDLGRLLGGTGTQAPVEWSEVDDELDDRRPPEEDTVAAAAAEAAGATRLRAASCR
jgi:hypothetical protein